MENAPTTTPIRPPPPYPLPAPPHPSAQITVLPAPPLPVAQISVFPDPPPPTFAAPPSSVNLSPLEFILALLAVVTIPALVYTFIFAFKFPSRRRSYDETSSAPAAVSAASGDGDAAISNLKYRKDAHVKEIGSECPVCLSVFADGEEVRQLSACKHSFHASCIDIWLSNHSNCPICRSTVAGKRPSSSSGPARDHDLQQGLPDAAALV